LSFLDLAKKRRSIRKYKPTPIPQDTLKYVLEAGRHAPSWKNLQCWRYIIVTDPDKRKAISTRDWVTSAPTIIVACADPTLSGTRYNQQYYILDMGISMEHIILAAAEKDLGTCWIGGQYDEPNIKQALGIPDEIRVVALTPIGYPAETPSPKDRKPMDEIVSYEKW
jgi:nitroreductase